MSLHIFHLNTCRTPVGLVKLWHDKVSMMNTVCSYAIKLAVDLLFLFSYCGSETEEPVSH